MKKFIVFMKNSYTLIGNEYFGIKDGIIYGFHDPNKATLFDSMEAAKKFTEAFDMPDICIESPEKHFKKFLKCTYVYRKITPINHELNVKYVKSTKEDVLKWWIETKKLPERSITYEVYKTWPNLYSVFNHIWDIQKFYANNNYNKTYTSFQIKTSRNAKFQDFKDEFLLIVNECDHLDKDGYKIFSIFDNGLSEYETRYLYYKTDLDCKIGGRRTDCGTLEEVFTIMKHSYWYGDED